MTLKIEKNSRMERVKFKKKINPATNANSDTSIPILKNYVTNRFRVKIEVVLPIDDYVFFSARVIILFCETTDFRRSF